MIVRSEPAPSGGPVVGAGSVRTRTVPLAVPSPPASESSLPKHDSPLITLSPHHDPAERAFLAQLVREREPSLASLVHEREPSGIGAERFYSALSELLERHVGIAIGEWNGSIPK